MKELSDLLAAATASVAPEYFHLSIHGGDPVYRERVYCYELYHQMRCRWPAACQFLLNGEVDKAGHPTLAPLGVGKAKPDFLIHQPGNMSGNHAVIEVKSVRATTHGVRKDIETLSLFRHRVGYSRAIYLIYGNAPDAYIDRMVATYGRAGLVEPIEVWVHRYAGEAAGHWGTLDREHRHVDHKMDGSHKRGRSARDTCP